jgi:hypothetical protein
MERAEYEVEAKFESSSTGAFPVGWPESLGAGSRSRIT